MDFSRITALAVVALVASSLTACELLPSRGGARLLREANERAVQGDLTNAEALVRRYTPDVGPDPISNRSAWCSRGPVKARLDAAGARAASSLVDAYRKSTDPLLRYVEVRRAFNSALEGEDQALESLCAMEPAKISTLDYDQTRSPIADEMAQIIAPLEQQARLKIKGRDFDKIVASAEAAAQKADREDMAAKCDQMGKTGSKQNAFERSAVQQQGENAMRLACSWFDTYSR